MSTSSRSLKIIVVVLVILTIIGFAGFAYEYEVGLSNSTQLSTYQTELTSIKASAGSARASFTQMNASLTGLNGTLTSLINMTASLNTKVAAEEQYLMTTSRIGIVSAANFEQAPLLAAMNVQGALNISGITFYLGTIGGHPVVSVWSGELEYAAELATYLMDTHFNITASINAGTAGANNPYVVPGDVVVAAVVVDKECVHYYSQGYQDDYGGFELILQPNSFFSNSSWTNLITEDQSPPTPQDASTYGYGPGNTVSSYVYTPVLPASLGLVQIAEGASSILGNTTIADITGNSSLTGSVPAKLLVGVAGSANVWTEPLNVIASQNALYQTDEEANEEVGFAYANAQAGVPWVAIRGLSDSPWYPSVYIGTLAADRADNVTIYMIDHFSTANLRSFASMSTLSPDSNAAIHGYLIATDAYYNITFPTEVQYIVANGTTITVTSPNGNEYILPSTDQYTPFSYSP